MKSPDNLVRRTLRENGATYTLEADAELDAEFLEAAEVLRGTPELMISAALSSFLSSYQSFLVQELEAQPTVKKH